MMESGEKKEKSKTQSLVDAVFSWSIPDVFNRDYYSQKVKPIPETFTTTDQYLKSFIYPLLEETRADLHSNLTTLSRAPFCEVLDVRIANGFKPPKGLYYVISLMKTSSEVEYMKKERVYKPEVGDLIAFTDVWPKYVDDLNRRKMPFVLALVQGPKDEQDPFNRPIVASKPIEFEKEARKEGERGNKLFAVYLTNLTTNIRIWEALNSDPAVSNMKIITSVLQVDPNVSGACLACSSESSKRPPQLYQRFGLDKSQETAVLDCIATRNCDHQNTVKLIWGPPGTGKTKTVASLLFALFRMKCRTLTCAPTNVAVIGVINRLISLLRPTLKDGSYGLGDIVLFGNGERMKIDDHEELFDVFLDYRVSCLSACFAPLSGFRASIAAMIWLLENPEEQYQLYLNMEREKEEKDDEEPRNDEQEVLSFMDRNANASGKKLDKVINNLGLKARKHKELRNLICQTVKENKKKKSKKLMHNKKERRKWAENLMSFEDFFRKKFVLIETRLIFCLRSLYTHLPTSFLPGEMANCVARVVYMLQALTNSFHNVAASGELRQVLSALRGRRNLNELGVTIGECLKKLKHIQVKVRLPDVCEDYQIRYFCLKSANLIFCTASSSSKLHRILEMEPFEVLIIDEAAQLKECESAIPLQLSGLRHAILIGDQKQLPAMVQSKISERAGFGRSLFERLESLGFPKNLLDVQYRMHPSISLFPNRQFYGMQIKDGANVRNGGYKKSFMGGSMYGSYSFIDINRGKEVFDEKHSKKNPVEIDVVAEIISNLHKRFLVSGQKVRVGCISPYKAQVFALQEKLGNTYSTDIKSDFSVNVRSVDGFQGGEEDIIIFSTVRCNATGSIGFLSDHQRTNVALTRARHCLWILGNSATLLHSGSVWKELVLDAKSRGCFYNACEDKNLVGAIYSTLISGGRLDDLLNTSHSMLFKNARWKVCFRDEFAKSFARLKDSEIRKEVVSLLVKLSCGWRGTQQSRTTIIEKYDASGMLLELYDVKGTQTLIWSIDIQRDHSRDIQVMLVWAIFPASEIPNLARRSEELFRNYTVSTICRCRIRKMEGNLVVPASWPLESSGESTCDDIAEILVGKLGTVSLRDQSEPKRHAKSSRITRMKQWKKKIP